MEHFARRGRGREKEAVPGECSFQQHFPPTSRCRNRCLPSTRTHNDPSAFHTSSRSTQQRNLPDVLRRDRNAGGGVLTDCDRFAQILDTFKSPRLPDARSTSMRRERPTSISVSSFFLSLSSSFPFLSSSFSFSFFFPPPFRSNRPIRS